MATCPNLTFSVMCRLLLFVVLCLHLTFAALPDGWMTCKTSSADYSKCLRKEIGQAITSLEKGNKKLRVIPIDPINFKKINIDQSNGPVAIKLSFDNFNIIGLSKCHLQSADIKNDWKTLVINNIYYDQIVITGLYKINGKVLILPIRGEGPSKLVFSNVTTDIKIDFKDVVKKNKEYFQVSDFIVDLKPKKVILNFENLFNGDKVLGDSMNLFLNENWEEIINELKPAIMKSLSEAFTLVSNQVFSHIPRNELDIK